MDEVAQLHLELNQSQQLWQRSSDPVRRMEVLRKLFRAVHRLYNETLARRELSAPNEIHALHRSLQELPQALEAFSPRSLQAALSRTDEMQVLLTGSALDSLRDDSAPAKIVETPEFLDRADRQWERLIWKASIGLPQWTLKSRTEEWELREFAIQAKPREQELSRHGIVLTVTCLSTSGDIRPWQWHYLSEEGNHEAC